MTYTVEVTSKHALSMLKSMEKAGMLTVRKERNRSIKQKKLSTAQQHAWNSIQQGLAEVKKFEDGTITLSTADDFLADWEKEIQAQSE